MTRDRKPAEHEIHRKTSDGSSPGVFALEAAGLLWLDEGPVRCAGVQDVGADFLELTRVESAAPTAEAARAFGRALAQTHDLGADGFGEAPPVPAASADWSQPAPQDGWRSGWFGPLEQPIEVPLEPTQTWGAFYGGQRVRPMLERLRERGVAETELEEIAAVVEALEAGRFDDGDRPARIHGDLWAGNLLWSPEGAVLIDPAAHGDHREQDLAFLSVFGAPHLEEILAGYQEAHPLRAGWQERTGLHQLFVLIAHAVLFDPPRGGSYLSATQAAASSALELL